MFLTGFHPRGKLLRPSYFKFLIQLGVSSNSWHAPSSRRRRELLSLCGRACIHLRMRSGVQDLVRASTSTCALPATLNISSPLQAPRSCSSPTSTSLTAPASSSCRAWVRGSGRARRAFARTCIGPSVGRVYPAWSPCPRSWSVTTQVSRGPPDRGDAFRAGRPWCARYNTECSAVQSRVYLGTLPPTCSARPGSCSATAMHPWCYRLAAKAKPPRAHAAATREHNPTSASRPCWSREPHRLHARLCSSCSARANRSTKCPTELKCEGRRKLPHGRRLVKTMPSQHKNHFCWVRGLNKSCLKSWGTNVCRFQSWGTISILWEEFRDKKYTFS